MGCGSYVEKYFLRANIMNTQRWILCPICGNKTRVMIRDDTELMNFPLFCPKCKKEVIINVVALMNECRNLLGKSLIIT